MRDWKTYKPAGETPPAAKPLVRKRQSAVTDPTDARDPEFEIALEVNPDQLSLLFDDTDKYEERPMGGAFDAKVDHQERWRVEGLVEMANVGETFGDWSDESKLEAFTYYRKATRLH